MTSPFATNFVFNKLSKKQYLETNAQGQPLQGQIPLTYQRYDGAGDETIAYDGSDVLVLSSVLSAGPLTIDFSAMSNYLGRTVQFLCEKAITNQVNLDFGTGDLYVPPFTSPLHSTTLTPDRSPTAAIFTFYEINKAMIVANPTVAPSNIIPGGPGQVLTTNAGTGVVDWENPQSVAPKSLSFKVSTDASNDYNTNTAVPLLFTETLINNTTLTLVNPSAGIVSIFTVNTPTKYHISASLFVTHDPTIASRSFIGVNSDIWCYQESSLGVTGQVMTANATLDLSEGDNFAFYVGNAAGAVTPLVPSQDYHGIITITEY